MLLRVMELPHREAWWCIGNHVRTCLSASRLNKGGAPRFPWPLLCSPIRVSEEVGLEGLVLRLRTVFQTALTIFFFCVPGRSSKTQLPNKARTTHTPRNLTALQCSQP